MSAPFAALPAFPELAELAAEALRPPERMTVSEFAERYRELKPGTTHRPGKWSNRVFPYLVPIMDAINVAIREGKRGVVLMKSGQGGGSEGMINALAWLKVYFPGPALYLISKDEFAREFGRDRFDHLNQTCAPLRAIHLPGRAEGELVHTKRYTTGKLMILGGRAVSNLETNPFRVVFIDEYDSMVDNIPGKGDPLANAEIRTDAFPGQTLVVAFAHPTTEDRCTGKLYYERSDQRRGFMACFHCGEEFWFQWEHVRSVPRKGQTRAAAERDASTYRYFTPCCEQELSDAQRYSMAEHVEQRTTLPPDEAARRTWVGVHFSQLYMNNKPLAWLAEKWIEGLEDENVRRVFVNKRLGDVYRQRMRETRPEDWRGCIVVARAPEDPHAYHLGDVPPGVAFLTSGQDSRQTELHWAVWGWGLVADAEGYKRLCGWLLDVGVVNREKTPTIEAADLAVFDQLLYERAFPRTDGDEVLRIQSGYHDSGWCPVAAYEYCLRWLGRAHPARGDNVDEVTARKRPAHRWGSPPTFRDAHGNDVCDPNLKPAILNTFVLKETLFGMVGKRFEQAGELGPHTRLVLPRDVPEDYLAQSSSEYLEKNKRGRLEWKHRGPNHWSDCNVQAFAAALNLQPFLQGQTRDEQIQQAQAQVQAQQRKRLRERAGGATHGRTRRRPIRRSY